MNDAVTEGADDGHKEILFSHWVLWESCIVAWKNIYIVLVAGLIFTMTGTFELYVSTHNALAVANEGTATFGPLVMMIFWGAQVAITSISLAILMYAVHSTVLDGASGWAVFAGDGKTKLKKLALRIFMALMVPLLVALLLQGLTALMGFKAGDRIHGGLGVIVFVGFAIFVVLSGVSLILLITWPASVIWSNYTTLRQAYYRGKKVFWYVLGRNVMVLLAMMALQLLIAVIFLPIVTTVLGAKDKTDVALKFFSPGFAFSISALNSLLAVVWFVLLSVIISRALQIGDWRLRNSQSGT